MVIQEAQPLDVPFMREMLYEAVFWRTAAERPSLEAALALPEVSTSLAGWGERHGDTAVVASVGATPVGSAWYRFWTSGHNVRGYLEEGTPVLVIGVRSGYRRRGIGTSLVGWLLERARLQSIPRLSLMVSKDNPALGLYRKQGFREYSDVGDSLLMVRDLPASRG